jgi:alkanesulfonate monooxygenase SsuD/methylene tetrahydromethanopterin reductase-like flavin-dependent oxidoreductase (luciferase family)
MRLGVVLIPTDPWSETVESAQRLERLGYDHVWVYDHLSWQRYRDRPWHATYPWLAGLAASTERIRLGTMVSNLNVRHPLTLAKDAMTIDHISGGRFTIGLGAAGTGFDATALGQAELSPSQRIERLAEAVPLIDGLLRGTIRNHAGTFYTVSEARVLPGCVQQPRLPLAIAAGGPRGLRIAAEHGDAWITYGDTRNREMSAAGTERVVAEQAQRLDELCVEFGRDPNTIDRIYMAGNTEARPLASLAAFEDFVGRYAQLGFTDLVFHMPRDDDPVWSAPSTIVEEIAQALLTQR